MNIIHDFYYCTSLLAFIPKGSNLVRVQFSSVAQSCPTLCDPMNRSTPGLPVHHQLLEFTQTRIHRVSDAIQPSHPQSSPSSPALNVTKDVRVQFFHALEILFYIQILLNTLLQIHTKV